VEIKQNRCDVFVFSREGDSLTEAISSFFTVQYNIAAYVYMYCTYQNKTQRPVFHMYYCKNSRGSLKKHGQVLKFSSLGAGSPFSHTYKRQIVSL